MSVFLTNYTLVKDDLIEIKVKAKNDYGWALLYSPENIIV